MDDVEKEMKPEKLVTELDSLLEMVRKEGEVSEKDVLKKLEISKEQLKEYIKILEEQNLVEVTYSTVGGMKIKKVGEKE